MKQTVAVMIFLLAVAVMIYFLAVAAPLFAGETPRDFDLLILNGMLCDGSGGTPVKADVGITGDRIKAVGNLKASSANTVIDARGFAVAPGFINMLSWSTASLLVDGRSQSEIRQGVTTEIMGEGESMGPLNDEMKQRMLSRQGDQKFDIAWTTLAEYLAHLEKRGISPNVASFIGSGTLREHVVGLQNRKPTPVEMERMCDLARREMEAGALGIGSSLIYAPDAYSTTEELINLCRVAAKYGGMYISHVRNEGEKLVEAVEELIRISREAGLPAEIYHLKAGGRSNWDKMDRAISLVDAARSRGLRITADVYLYTASSNRLASKVPAWAHEGGDEALVKRLRDPAAREKIASEMRRRGRIAKTLLIGFESGPLRPLTGKTLEEVARMRGKDQIETVLDLVVEDHAFTRVVTFSMSEENIRNQLRRPWVSLGSDAASIATEGVFVKSMTHPRAYGNFARLFAKYVRDEHVLSLQEAVRRVTGLPASNLGLDRRGLVREGYFADVVVFDPEKFSDVATYEDPHRYAVGMRHVFVNGVQVLKDGDHTGATPGRALKGPGKAVTSER
ncbi:MAG: D-aminoacylase [Syntrophobacteraceae bacterium]